MSTCIKKEKRKKAVHKSDGNFVKKVKIISVTSTKFFGKKGTVYFNSRFLIFELCHQIVRTGFSCLIQLFHKFYHS